MNESAGLSERVPPGCTSEQAVSLQDDGSPVPYCSQVWDGVLCWPRTGPGQTASQPCFGEFKGIKYDANQNATKWCFPNGTWNLADYLHCTELPMAAPPELDTGVEFTAQLYLIGYGISLLTLVIAVAIYLYYRELRCLRNIIHTNLMFTYILSDFLWIITTESQINLTTNVPMCIIFYSLYHYFQLTNFFWMFVEGLYLYMLVVKTFSGDTVKLKMCLFIGWGLPFLVVATWGTAKSFMENDLELQGPKEEALKQHCPWMMKHPYDWLYEVPAIFVLCVNVIFLFMIMWVLITKLRSANTAETQQYRKAAKALLVLIPLLGVTYILTLYGPTNGQAANVFEYFRAVLLSTQGLTVALFYCFLNSEVRNALKHHYERWRAERSLGGMTGQRYHAQLFAPCSRTESMRLYSRPTPTIAASNNHHAKEAILNDNHHHHHALITTTTVFTPSAVVPESDPTSAPLCPPTSPPPVQSATNVTASSPSSSPRPSKRRFFLRFSDNNNK